MYSGMLVKHFVQNRSWAYRNTVQTSAVADATNISIVVSDLLEDFLYLCLSVGLLYTVNDT
jgi:hypothetical protein